MAYATLAGVCLTRIFDGATIVSPVPARSPAKPTVLPDNTAGNIATSSEAVPRRKRARGKVHDAKSSLPQGGGEVRRSSKHDTSTGRSRGRDRDPKNVESSGTRLQEQVGRGEGSSGAAASEEARVKSQESDTTAARSGLASTFLARVAAAEAVACLVHTAPRADEGGGSRTDEAGQPVDASAVAGLNGSSSRARDVVMAEAGKRARSGWAWERELAFVLMESCACEYGTELNPDGGGGGVQKARCIR